MSVNFVYKRKKPLPLQETTSDVFSIPKKVGVRVWVVEK